MSPSSSWMQERMHEALEARLIKGTIRRLQWSSASDDLSGDPVDFSSNDYLGLAHDTEQHRLVEQEFEKELRKGHHAVLGATGSRLLSGDGPAFHQLEEYLKLIHNRPGALLFNSGYDANLTLVSCLPCDVIVYDEYVHNSLHMGMRLWKTGEELSSKTNSRKMMVSFQHNSVPDLMKTLRRLQTKHPAAKVVVVVESVYSMDGDVAPLKEMLDTAATFGAEVIVDEAHGLGAYGASDGKKLPGTGVVATEQVEDHPALLCSIHTFGKAAGCHGAVACFATTTHKEYVCNYGYPFIYSTALPLHSLVTIRCSYQTMTGTKGDRLRTTLFDLVHLFRLQLEPMLPSNRSVYLIPSTSPIQALVVPGNSECTRFCNILWEASQRRIRLFPIKSPTVLAGQERVRIIIHANNTRQQVELLVTLIVKTLQDMTLLRQPTSRL
jgi:8-amino-7-oxononanoate synthase